MRHRKGSQAKLNLVIVNIRALLPVSSVLYDCQHCKVNQSKCLVCYQHREENKTNEKHHAAKNSAWLQIPSNNGMLIVFWAGSCEESDKFSHGENFK